MGTYLGAALRGPLAAILPHHEGLTEFRRDLHANPELGFEEHRTAALVAERLRGFGIEVHTGIGKTGVVGVVRGKGERSTRSVGLRADMDALPMVEENEFAHRSTRAELMHGCGHDGHVTILLGAARYLAETRDFDGTVYLIFQPGEEGFAGAKAMMEDGLFERFPADEVYALHNWPRLPAGTIGLNSGPMMAAADRVEISVCGKGGHGAHPHLIVDPVLAAAHIVTAAQSIVARNVAPLDNAVLSLCAIHAGNLNAFSVVPREAKLTGTVRTFRTDVQEVVEQRLTELVETTARAFGAEGRTIYERIYPATINHPAQARFAGDVAAQLVGEDNVIRDLAPSMGAEDFAFMLQEKPGCYVRLGQGGGPSSSFLHSSRYDFNDAVIPLGAAFFAALAECRLPLPTR
ncbi:MAG: M20 family metallopeptidase [Betaproteobacteria bacterium]|nr:M20 family metallopeptidase [Betaproteobacteria bacterium]